MLDTPDASAASLSWWWLRKTCCEWLEVLHWRASYAMYARLADRVCPSSDFTKFMTQQQQHRSPAAKRLLLCTTSGRPLTIAGALSSIPTLQSTHTMMRSSVRASVERLQASFQRQVCITQRHHIRAATRCLSTAPKAAGEADELDDAALKMKQPFAKYKLEPG